jgi:hypothetical protein
MSAAMACMIMSNIKFLICHEQRSAIYYKSIIDNTFNYHNANYYYNSDHAVLYLVL